MMALAEKHFGLGRELNDALFVEVGMGIGASIFIDGKLYRGPGGSAGEFGHMTIDEDGPLCSCGNRGCLEAMASGARHYSCCPECDRARCQLEGARNGGW